MMPEKQSALPNEAQPRITRTLMTLALCYALGVVWRALEWGGQDFCIVLAGILTLAAWLGGRRRLAACFAAVLLGGVAAFCALLPDMQGFTPPTGQVLVRGVAQEVRQDGDTLRLTLDHIVLEKENRALEGKAAVTSYTQPAFTLACGQTVTLRTEIEHLRGPTNPGGVDYTLPNKADGIFFTMRGEAFSLVQPADPYSPAVWAENLRGYVTGQIEQVFKASAPLMKGILIGNTDALSAADQEALRAAGISHLTAASGLHAGIVAAALWAVLKLFHARRRTRAIWTVAVMGLYCTLVGFTPSIVRAALMLCVVLLSDLTGRRVDAPTQLAAVFWGILIFSPLDIFTLSFQLSFAAAAGLIALARPLERALTFLPRWVASALAVPVAAQLGTLPVVLAHFHELPVFSLVCNIIAVPYATVLLLAGLVALLPALVFPALAAYTGDVVAYLAGWLLDGARWVADIPGSMVHLPPLSPLWITGLALLLILCGRYDFFGRIHRKSWLCIGLSAVLTLGAVIGWLPLRGELRLTVLDVGQGDAMVLQTPGGKAYLIDAGPADEGYDLGESRVVPALYAMGITRLEGAAATHLHSDHAGGMAAVVRAMRPQTFYSSEAPDESWQALNAALSGCGAQTQVLGAGDTLAWDGVNVRVLSPQEGQKGQRSLVLEIEYQGMTMLICGDLEPNEEEELLKRMPPAEVLKVAHHGSGNVTGEDFLHRVSPKVALISVGASNTYGHPAPETLMRLYEAGAQVLRTDEKGALTVSMRDGRVHIDYFIKEKAAPKEKPWIITHS